MHSFVAFVVTLKLFFLSLHCFLKLRAVPANRELIDFPHELREANLHGHQDPSRLQSQDIADSDLMLFLLAFCVVLLFRVSFFPQPFSSHSLPVV